LAVAAVALATPAVAGAAVRSATFGYDKPEQPLSLNPQPPITQQAEYPQAITVAYDEGGAVAVHIAIYDAATWSWRLPPLTLDVSSDCDGGAADISAGFRYTRYDGTNDDGTPTSEVDATASLTRRGFEGAAAGTVAPAPDGFDVRFEHAALAALDLRCAQISSSSSDLWNGSGYFAGFEPFVLTESNATTAFKRLLAARYGTVFTQAGESWAVCPHAEFFPPADNDDDGEYDEGLPAAICMAQFRRGRTWRYVSGRIEEGRDDAVFEPKPYSRAWTRKWRRLPAKCLRQVRVHGRAWSNDGTCPALMVSDLAYDVRRGKKPKFAYWHGTNTAGFSTVAYYRCKTRGRTVTCTNRLGDAFRWTR
jgi:hypothetical protein